MSADAVKNVQDALKGIEALGDSAQALADQLKRDTLAGMEGVAVVKKGIADPLSDAVTNLTNFSKLLLKPAPNDGAAKEAAPVVPPAKEVGK